MINSIKRIGHAERPQPLTLVTEIFFAIFFVLTIRYQINLLTYIEWGDESETIVAAKMIAAGSSLYSEIFNHHGPLTFLPGVLLETLGDFGIPGHRISMAVLQLFSLGAIYFSPLLTNRDVSKLYTGVAASVMMLYLPQIYGHTYQYQVMAGLLLVIILAQYTLPAISCPERLAANHIILGNLLIGSLPFLAVTYLPISVLLFISSIRKQFIAKSFVYLSIGFWLNFLFLAYVGSIPGYFAFHIYLNSQILPLYNGGQSASQLIIQAFSGTTSGLSEFIVLTVIAIAIAKLASYEKMFPWRSMLVGVGIGSLLIRGSGGVTADAAKQSVAGLYGLPYFYSVLAFPLVFFKNRPRLNYQSGLIALALSIICFIKLSLFIPADKQNLISRQMPETTEFAQLVELLTSKQDRIIAYSFQNFQYIAADRLPASGHFFYLPWQEKYNENPIFGIKIDACKEIEANRPKIMLIDKWEVWDRFPWDSYAGCIQKIIDKDYYQIVDRPYYVRKDILPNTWIHNVVAR